VVLTFFLASCATLQIFAPNLRSGEICKLSLRIYLRRGALQRDSKKNLWKGKSAKYQNAIFN